MNTRNSLNLEGYVKGAIAFDTWQSESGETRAKARFLLGVRRNGGNGIKPSYDIIPVITWGKSAETIVLRAIKGSRIAVYGHIRSDFYLPKGADKEKLSTTVVADSISYFAPPSAVGDVAADTVPHAKRRGGEAA